MNISTNELASTYQATLDYLYSYVDYSLVRNFRYNPGQFELGRMHTLMDALGDPHLHYPIIHIAGTKGKGSVSALCASALRAAGYSTGLYTSPHLEDFTERIQVDGKAISQPDFIQLVDELRPIIEKIPKLTFFEITTALAYTFFARQNVDAAVIEVGLGGRLDATNVCQPVVSVITSLSYDHMAVLGNTLTQIAAEKAGIIKPGVPVISAPQKGEAMQVLEQIAQKANSPLIRVGRDVLFAPLEHSLEGQSLQIWPRQGEAPVELCLPLLGAHQLENAAVAFTALRTAQKSWNLNLNDTAIANGFKNVVWPGRFEVLQRAPYLVLDCAHNGDSAHKLKQALADYFPGRSVILVFGASEDKDVKSMFDELLPTVSRAVVVKSFHPRAADPEELVKLIKSYDKTAQQIPDVADALFAALNMADQDSVVLVTGSIFVVAGARQAWLSKRSEE